MLPTPARLIALADEIDERLSPIPGRRADEIAVIFRSLAVHLAGIPHPTGSEQFAVALVALQVPPPWRLCDEEVGEVLAANGAIAFQVDMHRERPDTDASAIAAWIICAVNTLAGFKAEPASPPGR